VTDTARDPGDAALPDPATVRDPVPDALPDEVSLRRRVVNVRTLGSLAFGVVLLVLLFRVIFGADFDWGLVGRLIAEADPAFLGLAFVAYYATFPLRSLRWRFVLSRSGVRIGFGDATEILFLSWFVNCLVPAKLGDVYRAYLLRGNFGASIPRTLGTIFIERIADLIVIAVLALAAGFWSFRGRSRPEMDALFITGFAIALSLLVVVIVLRQMGAHLTRFLPRRVGVLWDRFHEGSTGALTVRSVPVIIGITLVIWILEGARLYFVIRALDLPGADMGISASVFVALAAALLTAIPLTPAGFGFVEAGIVGLLALYGVIREPATAVALTDRALTIVTVIVLGAILYAVSGKIRRAHGLSAAT
jgi:glycosyltransferase 2 family protein